MLSLYSLLSVCVCARKKKKRKEKRRAQKRFTFYLQRYTGIHNIKKKRRKSDPPKSIYFYVKLNVNSVGTILYCVLIFRAGTGEINKS